MSECSALATKPEVKKVEQNLSTKIDKSEKPGIIQKASVAGAAIAVAATDPRIQKILAELAKLGSSLKSLAGKIFNLFDKISGILSLIGLLATAVQLQILNARVNKQDRIINQIGAEAAFADTKANIAIAGANEATRLANIAIANANKAIADANVAKADARIARVDANTAIKEANTAKAEANKATNLANTARAEASEAAYQANLARIAAYLAQDRANTAYNLASEARALADIVDNLAHINRDNIAKLNREATNLRTEIAQLRGKVGLLDSDIDAFRVALQTAFQKISDLQAKINDKETKPVVKQVKKATVTNFSDITTLKSSARKLESSIDIGDRNALNKILELKAKIEKIKNKQDIDLGKGITKIIRLGGGAGLNSAQVKDIVTTEIQAQVEAQAKVNDQQYKDLSKQIAGVGVLIGGLSIPAINTRLTNISNGVSRTVSQTSAPAIQSAATAGVCSTTAPGGCINQNVTQPLQNQIGNLISAGGTAFSAANNALLLRMSGTLNAVNATVNVIRGTTTATFSAVSNARYGLEAVQNFASTAWRATQADKVLNVISTVLAVHNGMMLSNNLGSTIGEALNMGLQALGIQDETNNPIDINAIVKGKMSALLTNILGAENYAALTARLAKTNRIYQASINVLDTTRNLFDSAQSIAELGIEHTGQIGNALRDAGVVAEDAYGEMVERVNPQNAALRKIAKFREGVDNIEEVVSSVTSVSSEVIEIRENFTQLKTEKEALLEEIGVDKEERAIEREEVRVESTVTANISTADFERNEPDSGT